MVPYMTIKDVKPFVREASLRDTVQKVLTLGDIFYLGSILVRKDNEKNA